MNSMKDPVWVHVHVQYASTKGRYRKVAEGYEKVEKGTKSRPIGYRR